MNWAAAVIYGGRVFLRRVIDLTNTLRQKMDRVLLSSDMRHDIAFWLEFMTSFNGKTSNQSQQFTQMPVWRVAAACTVMTGFTVTGHWTGQQWTHCTLTTKNCWQWCWRRQGGRPCGAVSAFTLKTDISHML